MNETVGQAVYVIKLDDKQAVQQLDDFTQRLNNTASSGEQSTKSLAGGFDQLVSAVGNLATAHLAFSGITSSISDLTGAYNEYKAAMSGVGAVASATGNDVTASLEAVKTASAGGLISQADAAASIKNLQLYGYSVEQATQMIQIMTDAAVYNRQANYSVSEAVRVTTEGIRMENSVLSDASGITTNIAKMQENYAAQLGKSVNNLTDAEKAQAVYNGFLQEGALFAGNAESYTSTLAGAQQQLDTAMQEVKQTMGAVFAQFAPIVKGFADWVSQNKELVAGLGIFVGILTAGAGLVAALRLATQAITAVRTALTAMTVIQKTATLGFVGLAAAAAGLGAAMLVSNAINTMADDMQKAGTQTQKTTNNIQTLGGTSDKSAEQIAKLNEQLVKLERDYRRDLKQIAVDHEKNLATLTQQIEEANVDYKRAIDERMADFNVTLAKQERSHQETVDELMTQLAFLQRYNNDYNKQKLAQVQFALAKEQELYKRQTEAEQAEIELQNEADRQKLEQKLASLQQELDDEMAFMNKHRDALNVVRGDILLDEVESLRERYEKQKKSYEDQIVEAGNYGADASEMYQQGWDEAMNTLPVDVQSNLYSEGLEAGNTFNKGLIRSVGGYLAEGGPAASIWKAILGDEWFDQLRGKSSSSQGGYASGGYTGRGAPDEVAGVVHKGEYVVPADMVNQSTGEPKMGVTQNITINLSGVLATSAQAKRELAQDLQKALAQVNQARFA